MGFDQYWGLAGHEIGYCSLFSQYKHEDILHHFFDGWLMTAWVLVKKMLNANRVEQQISNDMFKDTIAGLLIDYILGILTYRSYLKYSTKTSWIINLSCSR